MSILDYLYMREATAVAHGMTHEGRMFGVPAWLAETSDNELVGVPKVPALQLWCLAVDRLMELATYFMSEDAALLTPITLGRRI